MLVSELVLVLLLVLLRVTCTAREYVSHAVARACCFFRVACRYSLTLTRTHSPSHASQVRPRRPSARSRSRRGVMPPTATCACSWARPMSRPSSVRRGRTTPWSCCTFRGARARSGSHPSGSRSPSGTRGTAGCLWPSLTRAAVCSRRSAATPHKATARALGSPRATSHGTTLADSVPGAALSARYIHRPGECQ